MVSKFFSDGGFVYVCVCVCKLLVKTFVLSVAKLFPLLTADGGCTVGTFHQRPRVVSRGTGRRREGVPVVVVPLRGSSQGLSIVL